MMCKRQNSKSEEEFVTSVMSKIQAIADWQEKHPNTDAVQEYADKTGSFRGIEEYLRGLNDKH